jgi:hypothetical protein
MKSTKAKPCSGADTVAEENYVCISSYQKPCHIKHVAVTQSDPRPKTIVFIRVICYIKPSRLGNVCFCC